MRMRAEGSRVSELGELGGAASVAPARRGAALPFAAEGGAGAAGVDPAARSNASTRVVVRGSFTRTGRLYVPAFEGSSPLEHDLPALSRPR
jgi:hypothetical protein